MQKQEFTSYCGHESIVEGVSINIQEGGCIDGHSGEVVNKY